MKLKNEKYFNGKPNPFYVDADSAVLRDLENGYMRETLHEMNHWLKDVDTPIGTRDKELPEQYENTEEPVF